MKKNKLAWAAAGVLAASLCPIGAQAYYPVERPAREKPAEPEGNYTIFPDQPRQVIKGLGFEIQSDSIESGNKGISEATTSVPHDLVPSERQRFYKEMLKGFRYCRLAGGLYWRGLDAEEKHLQGRWPEQMDELKEMISKAGIEGVSLEYWSPAPFWKANRQYIGGANKTPKKENVIRCFGEDFANDPDYHGDTARFLADFAEANVANIRYLRDHGVPVSMWGLQNEPKYNQSTYPSCWYRSPEEYAQVFNALAQAVRTFDPKIWIIADTSINLEFIKPVLKDPEKAKLVDALVIHQVGFDANRVPRKDPKETKPLFQNEYEYLNGPASPDRCMNTVLCIMNWFQRAESPTWFWIHALKPYKNAEASGYSLGFWRPIDDADPEHDAKYKGLKPGHWSWNPYNWNAVGSFLRHMPWDCTALAIKNGKFDPDLRVFAFRKPDGKVTVVLANRSFGAHTFHLSGLPKGNYVGYRYTPDEAGPNTAGMKIGALSGETISPVVADRTWEFWEQQ